MTIFIIVYIISFINAYIYVRCMYSKNGVFSGENPSLRDVAVVVMPFLNTLSFFFWIFFWPFDDESDFPNKFFRIKKSE